MKKILLFVNLFTLPVLASSQWSGDTITFEKNSQLVHIDTSQHPNVWEIGSPHKSYFTSAYSPPYAIVTDTIHTPLVGTVSSFILGATLCGTNCALEISFWHKYQTDSLFSGGYLEISVDTGKTWVNIANIPGHQWVYNSDTIMGGIPAFTGQSDGWQYFSDRFCGIAPGNGDSVLLKVTYNKSKVLAPGDGWMIDNIYFGSVICEGIQEVGKDKGSIQVYPNPSNTEVNLLYRFSSASHKATLNLYNPVGQLVKSETINNNTGTLTEDVSALPDGIYYYRLVADGLPVAVNKLVIIK